MKKKILIIEDDNEIYESLKLTCLRLSDDCEIVRAKNGKEGLKTLEKERSDIHFIMLDYQMPVMNGLDTLKEIRKKDRAIKIFMMSGTGDIEEQAKEYGADRFISKPFPNDFYEILKKTLNEK
ncbi:MAG: response regulator [bacterium]|nr:response regulator [bacterium]